MPLVFNRWLAVPRLAVLIAAAACFGGFSTGSHAQQPPAWFVNPPADTADAWHGSGEGPDPEAARRSALRSVAARLRSAITGVVESTVTDANGRVSRIDKVNVAEEVMRTEFTGVEVLNTARSAAGYLVLVKVDRQAFLRDTRAKLEVLARPIAEAEAALPGASSLEQFIALRRVSAQVADAINLSLLLAGAGEATEGTAAFKRYSNLRQRADASAAAMVFELRARPEDQDIAKVVAGSLADKGIRTSLVPARGVNVVQVESSVRQDELFGDKLVKLKVRFSVLDADGRAVASREHDLSGASRYDFRAAREQALNRLHDRFRDDGATAVLGFRE